MPESAPVVRTLDIADTVYDITWQTAEEGPDITQGERHRSYFFDLPGDLLGCLDRLRFDLFVRRRRICVI